ncbi:hypothetical protein TTHERM_01026330 (macronuclear) [Tetrahymena thermophila SB210]|uniref:MORN motif protein n=1 Tax=Tetrahymena thermophila (strain SB210) TaxID=312017 RepID=Q22CP6_TETTS|nr:hypothetical protein TTHERM_01026330 [Tetrahymena thermophila SB210]EAR83069.2 hypothetical protein TTHERM_01026330 [Tetrahymena thermophila SB210]|eukprot:XP_001030732.2 hypothetical protein TTHERM_01026330 [Tetrahymena thermophila SB210]
MTSYQLNSNCKEFQMIEFDNGYYQGEMQNMKREGFGVFYWDSGQIYLGKWSKDFMEDEGVVYFSEGGCAYGNFRRNKLNGYACVLDPFENMIVGQFSKGILDNGVWYEKLTNKWFRYDTQNSEPNKNYELTTKSQIPQVVTLKEVIKRIFHGCQGRSCIRYIEYPDTTFYLGVAGESGKQPSGLGVLHDYDNKVLQVGHHKGKKLNGVGRQYLGFMINDGIFEKQEFKYGTQYFIRDKKFFYGFFNGNQIKKIIKSGIGYPGYLLAYYKHPSKYANAKIDKEQEQEVMHNYQSQYVHNSNIVGYSEIYKCSPKKKNLLMFVENKFCEDFISPHTSIYQEVLEAAQYQRAQKQNSSLSPMQRKKLQLYEDDESNFQSKQFSSKISPSSSQSSYIPSNLRINNLKNKQTPKSKDFFNTSTDKKKNKQVDIQQNEFQSTQKKIKNSSQNSQMKESNMSNQDNQHHIFIQDSIQLDYVNTQPQEQQFNRQMEKQSMDNSNSNQNLAKISLLKNERLQQKLLKGSNEFNNINVQCQNPFDNQQIEQNIDQSFSQNSGNQSNQNEIISSSQNKQENKIYSLYSSTNQSSNLADNQNMQFFQPTVSISDELLIKQQILQQEREKKSFQSSQFQLDEQNDCIDGETNLNEENMQMQIQQMLQTFNAKNQTGKQFSVDSNRLHFSHENRLPLDGKIKESFQIQNNNSHAQQNQFKEYSLGSQQMNEMLGSQYQNSLHESKNINVDNELFLCNNQQNNQQLLEQIKQFAFPNAQQQYEEQFYDEIPNTLAPDNKVETSSRRNSSEINLDESDNTNDKRKHETPRFDLKQANKRLLNELDSTYQNAAKEVSSLFKDIKNQINNQDEILSEQCNQESNKNLTLNQDIQKKLQNQLNLKQQNHLDIRNSFQENSVFESVQNGILNYPNQIEIQESQLVDTFQNCQGQQINDIKQMQNQNSSQDNSSYLANILRKQQIDYKINQPSFQLNEESPENIQEDLIEQIKRMRKNTNESRDNQNINQKNVQTEQQSVQQQKVQTNGGNSLSDYLVQNNQNFLEESLGKNSFDGRNRLESIQLPVTPPNLSYNYQDKRTENQLNMDKIKNQNNKEEATKLEYNKNEDSIRFSETQNQQIIQKLTNLNQVKRRKDTSDSFECNINQSQNDFNFNDSQAQFQVQSVKNEENYKSLMQIIPENKETESTKNSDIQQQNLKDKILDQTRYKSVSVVSYDHFSKNNNKINLHLPNQNAFFDVQNNDLLKQNEDLNCTIEDEDEEKKVKFHFINQSPSRPFLTQTSAYKKRRRIFENPLNSSFSTVSPSMSKHTYSPNQNQSMNLNVFIPSNNEQRISEFNFKKVAQSQIQNKLEYSANELRDIKQFNLEKNRLDTNSSFDKLNISENHLIFTNPQINQIQEYSTQNTNNHFNSNTTHLRNKSNCSSHQFMSNQYNNTNPHLINQNQSQQKLRNIPHHNQNHHQRIHSQQDFKSYYNSNQTLQDFNNLSTGNNNFESLNNIQNPHQFNSCNPQSSAFNKQQISSFVKPEKQNLEMKQPSQSLIKTPKDQQEFLKYNLNQLGNQVPIRQESKTLRQIIDTSIDKSQSPKYQGFFSQNGLQQKKASFFTNSGCEPIMSFKVQQKEFKDQYNSSKIELSRHLQQSLNELSEQNLSFTYASHQINNQNNSQNDLVFYDEENNKINIKKYGQKESTQFQHVQANSSIQSKENNSFHSAFTHKQRQNKFNLNLNLSSINDESNLQKQSKIQSLSQTSKNTISLSEILKQNQKQNSNTFEQFKSLTPSNVQNKQPQIQFKAQNHIKSQNNFKKI